MNKPKLSLIVVLSVIFFCFCGCDANEISPPKISTDLLPPYLISFGSYISWDTVKNATEYDVYCNENLIATTQITTYEIGNSISDANYYVVAKNKNKKSDKSNIVLVSKSYNFDNSEILDLSNTFSYNAAVPSSIRKIIISNNFSTSFNLSANILKRNTDLTFELHNVDILGRINTFDNSYSRIDQNYNVIFHIRGNCSIQGNHGVNGSDFSDSRYNNSESNAGDGGNGNDAIVVPTAIFTGCGNVKIFGGNGGNGGIGSATTTWEASKVPGKGSNGGNGGAGIKTSFFILNMDNGTYDIAVTDGIGGKKGSPGNNGSIITGPVVSAMWKSIYDIGKSGKDGRSSFGTKKILNGKLNY